MKATPKIRNTSSALRFGYLIVFMLVAAHVAAQNNYTVGDNSGEDHTGYLYAPFYWEGVSGEEEYLNHVCQDWGNTCGQHYDEESDCMEYSPPNPGPSCCHLYDFLEIIAGSTEYMGTLLITTHGNAEFFGVEAYSYSQAGKDARNAKYSEYLTAGYSAEEIWPCEVPGVSWSICATDDFIRHYGDLSQGLVFVGACQGSTLIDDFMWANARVALGTIDTQLPSFIRSQVNTFFLRMDGKEGQAKRQANVARNGISSLAAMGQLNTTLSPSVLNVTSPNPLKLWDTITVHFDTKCDTYATPEIRSNWGDVTDEEWVDSTTLRAIYSELPPSGITQCQFTLTSDYVWSGRNWASLDGNTNPPGGANAQGPAPDDYEWTMAVDPCNCGRTTTPRMWADVSNDVAINAVDVVRMVSYVYKSQTTAIMAPPGTTYPNCPLPAVPPFTCQFRLGDVNRDGTVTPPDLVRYVNYVYKLQVEAILDNPCLGGMEESAGSPSPIAGGPAD